ncbi:MAG TPA: hypothetical protein VK826_02325 [Bacteroidia bacterium]|nr:hypothetical protein [Bacteroidia bacterium]
MKQFILLWLLASFAMDAHADCHSSGISVFPNGSTLRQNSILVIEGYGTSQKIISGLNSTYPVYLKSGDKRVELVVKETLVGQFLLTQAVLQPSHLLETGLTYTLVIENMPSSEVYGRYDPETRKWKQLTFTVISGNDTTSPVVTGKPVEIRKSFIWYGCGPQKWVIFSCPVSDSSAFMVRTTVKDLTSGKETTYLLDPMNTEVIVGHDMCSGAFHFPGDENYEVSFSYMDASGNVTSPTEWIKFSEPVPADGEGD